MQHHFYTQKNNQIILHVQLQPNAKKDEVVGVIDQHLKIKINAQPIEDKANKKLIKFLSKQLKVPQSDITIIKGHHGKQKTILIDSPQDIKMRISALAVRQ